MGGEALGWVLTAVGFEIGVEGCPAGGARVGGDFGVFAVGGVDILVRYMATVNVHRETAVFGGGCVILRWFIVSIWFGR